MGWVRTTLALAVGLSACTSPNPLYDPDRGSAGEDPTDGEGTTTPPPDETRGEDTRSSAEGTTQVSDSLGTDDGPITASDSQGSDSTGPVDTGPPVCEPVFPPAFHMEIIDWNPGICDAAVAVSMAPSRMGVGTFSAYMCPACPCPEDPITLRNVVHDLELPLLPPCFGVNLQLATSDGGSCEIVAFSLLGIEGPVLIASNVVNPEFFEPFDFVLGEAPVEVCPNQCPVSGTYALLGGNGGVVPPDGMGTMVSGPGGAVGMTVFNLGSGIDQECKERGRWIATPLDGSDPA